MGDILSITTTGARFALLFQSGKEGQLLTFCKV
jgi:hypothetical protein